MKKDRKTLKSVLIIALIVILVVILGCGLIYAVMSFLPKKIDGIENYNKLYYIENYGGDLDSNLSIFPDDKSVFIEPTFKSSMLTGLFDTDGYIILTSKYNLDNFNKEIERLSSLSMTIKNGCLKDSDSHTNYVKYDTTSYRYPSYVTIDGFGSTYEYALINKDELKIIYVYLSYPNTYDTNYKEYLKKDISTYSKENTLNSFSMYNHTFNNGESYMEFDDCK